VTNIPLVRMNALHGVIALLRQLDIPIDRSLAEVKLTPLILHEPEALIPLKQALELIEAIAAKEGIEQFGLLAGQQTSIAHLGALGRLLCHSLSLHNAINSLIGLIHSYNSGEHIWLESQAEAVWLCRKFTQKLEMDYPQSVHYSLILLIQLVRLAAGSQWQPKEVCLTTDPIPNMDQVELFSDTKIHFNQTKTAILIPKSLLSLTLPNCECYGQQQQNNDYKMLQSFDYSTGFLEAIKHIIVTQFRQGYPNIELIAEILGISVRSLQRQLKQFNLNYSQLVEQTRFEYSVKLLRDPAHKIADIAVEIGYKDAANFARAFKRWTGISPKAYSIQHFR